ncbi:23756_t:CDS:1 [Gigaspora margarita]|nr:23756_t:CDS:1 [Gigaspora margarita]
MRVVELLTAQRRDAIEVIRSVNTGITDLISLLQEKNPEPPVETAQINANQLLNTIAEQLKGSGIEHNEGLDYQFDWGYFDKDDEFNSKNDEGLRTELALLQSQVNRLRTEQMKLTTSFDEKDKEKERIHKNHANRRSKVLSEGTNE